MSWLIVLHTKCPEPCDYLSKTSIKINMATDEGEFKAETEYDTEQKMKLEWLYKVGSE